VTGTMPRREAMIGAALEQCAEKVESVGRGRWRIGLANGKPFAATARLEDGWLVLEARPALPRPTALLWELLTLNGAIGSGSKLTLPPDGGALHLRAEVPAWDDASVTQRLVEACRSLEEAHGCVGSGKLVQPAPGATVTTVDVREKADAGDLPQLLSEAGWPRAERKREDLAVQLDVPGAFYQACVEVRARGEVRIGVEVAAAETFSPAVRRALGRLLLVGSGLVRLVRAAAATNGAGDSARFEVGFRSLPSAAELDVALGALSVACRCFGREAKALAREDVASTYLELGGWAEPASPPLPRASRMRRAVLGREASIKQ